MLTNNSLGVLSGKLIIDLTRVLGGPFCTQILGDHGADVVKIEPPLGDETRDWGPPFHDGDGAYYIGVNRNKRSLGLDLNLQEGKEVLFRLLESADVLIENFKPGTMERWGLGYENVLSERFPKLIHCRISGFGEDGPLGGFPGYDAIVQAITGWFSVNGDPQNQPTRLGLPLVDMGTGLYTTIGVLLALIEREKSGIGQYLDMTLFDCAIALMHPHIPNFMYSNEVPVPTGNAHPNISPYDTFRTKTVDLFIGAGNNGAFFKLCKAIERPELVEDPRFKDNINRVENRDELKVELETSLIRIDGATLYETLANAGLAAGPIYDTNQIVGHPHTEHREMILEAGDYKGVASPIKLSRTPGSVRHMPPKFSEHATAILSDLGFTEEEVEGLTKEAVIVKRRLK
ncbi:MAG: CoA transferase [Gammaproteobacteria bacterium]|nr:CoA transferase [Gammaproteobacteria bacterium]